MYFDDYKKGTTTIMAKRKPSGQKMMEMPMKPEVMKFEGGEVDGRHIAAQDMMGAFHEKSPAKFMEALSHFLDIHESLKDSESSS